MACGEIQTTNVLRPVSSVRIVFPFLYIRVVSQGKVFKDKLGLWNVRKSRSRI